MISSLLHKESKQMPFKLLSNLAKLKYVINKAKWNTSFYKKNEIENQIN